MEKVKQKQEANARMKLLKLHENVIREFEKEGIVNLSENGGFLYWLNGDQQAIVDDFEAEHEFFSPMRAKLRRRIKKRRMRTIW